jgi:hypothetical protein
MVSSYLLLYIGIGIVCGLCFDILYHKFDMEEPSMFERLFWFIAWPLFLFIFLYAIYNDKDDDE